VHLEIFFSFADDSEGADTVGIYCEWMGYTLNYDWNFGRLLPYWRAFLSGTFTTLSLTVLVVLIGTALGIAMGLLLSKRSLRPVLHPAVDVLRAVPPLVLILFMYYLLTQQVIGVTVAAFWVCAIAMSLNLAAFTADLVRAGIANVPAAAIDAGYALGMSHRQLTRHVVLPYVIREIIPGMTVLYIGMLKMSSLASVINVREVVYTAQTVIADVSRSLEAWTIVAVIYVALVVPSTYAVRRIENWSGRKSPLS
jgi:polar amino acid transport system permease protein